MCFIRCFSHNPLFKKSGLFLVLWLFSSVILFSQSLPVPRNMLSAYAKKTRSHTGQPGSAYWQNTAVYNINISFDPSTRYIQGNETIDYVNNSPDTLDRVVFKLFPNYYKKGAARAKEINPEDISEGMSVKEILINKRAVSSGDILTESTNMTIRTTIYPGQRVQFMLYFSYELNKGSHNRTGQVDEGSHFVAYFYPRITVYDDVDGWNLYPYTGSYEFYNDFCDFNLSVRIPSDYIVWATGDHVNSAEVFSEAIQSRIEKAAKEDVPVTIIDSSDLPDRGTITKGREINVWKFVSQHVPDIAFAVSNHYMWQSASLVVDSNTNRRTRVDAVFNPVHKDYFHVLSDAVKTISCMSFRFPKWPFPYSHETIFDGLDQMEYPMMANDNPVEDRTESIELTDHEIFHTMFPFYMGINETKYGWMDEGWATLGEWLISPMIDPTIVDQYGLVRCEKAAGTESDGVIMNITPSLVGEGFFVNSYPKPALGYLYVKDMLGDDVFFKGLHHYIRTWNGKHPLPLDFFACMNEGSGKDLNWFWLNWFYEQGVPDLSIADVKENGRNKSVVVERIGSKYVPVDITVKYRDGSQETFHSSVEVWKKGDRKISIPFQTSRTIQSVELGSTYTVDVDRSNNTFIVK
jgi:hypothetical protein